MIKVTLEYPDLESLMAAMAKLQPATNTVVMATVAVEEPVKAPKPAKAEKAKTEAPAPTPTVSATVTSQPATESVSTEPAQASPSEAIEYDVVQKAITTKVKDNRDAVVALLAKFGVKKGTELKAEQYADFLAELG